MKTISRFLSAGVLLALTAALVFVAKNFQDFFASWYPDLSQWLLGVIGGFTNSVPLPLWMLGLALAALWAVYSLIRNLMKGKFLRWVAGLTWGLSFFLFAFVLLWGAGHYLPTKTESILEVKTYSAQELAEATRFYAQRVDLYAPQMTRGEDGKVVLPEFDTMAREAENCCTALAARYKAIPTAELQAKELLLGDLFGYLGITGIFVPVTAESSVSPHTYPSSMPYTICHELAHRLGACAEEDANFLAFLACMESDDAIFRYSANYSAFIYCFNALSEVDRETAEEIWWGMSDLSRSDISLATAHYAPYEGKVQELSDSVNDAYLKAAGQEAGSRSYGLVSDALIAWYQENYL